MGVTVRRRKGKPGWWMFVNHQGKQYKKYFGLNKKLATEVAAQVEARLKLGEFGLLTRPACIFANMRKGGTH